MCKLSCKISLSLSLYHSLSKICDKEWHYYVINVEFPVVTLYVDGVTYDPYLVTDDWPIHPSQIDVQLTVGACWQGEWPVQTVTAPRRRLIQDQPIQRELCRPTLRSL